MDLSARSQVLKTDLRCLRRSLQLCEASISHPNSITFLTTKQRPTGCNHGRAPLSVAPRQSAYSILNDSAMLQKKISVEIIPEYKGVGEEEDVSFCIRKRGGEYCSPLLQNLASKIQDNQQGNTGFSAARQRNLALWVCQSRLQYFQEEMLSTNILEWQTGP